jgi:hypothetical protein
MKKLIAILVVLVLAVNIHGANAAPLAGVGLREVQ